MKKAFCNCGFFSQNEEQSKDVDESQVVPTRSIDKRAIKVKFLKEFCSKYPEVLTLKTWEVVQKYIMKHTRSDDGGIGIRYCELDGVNPGNAEIFISHAWNAEFGSLVSAIC